MARKRRPLVLAPLLSARRSAWQWITWTPAARAASISAASCGTTAAASLPRSGIEARSPITPRCISEVTSAVCSGAIRAARSRGMTGSSLRGRAFSQLPGAQSSFGILLRHELEEGSRGARAPPRAGTGAGWRGRRREAARPRAPHGARAHRRAGRQGQLPRAGRHRRRSRARRGRQPHRLHALERRHGHRRARRAALRDRWRRLHRAGRRLHRGLGAQGALHRPAGDPATHPARATAGRRRRLHQGRERHQGALRLRLHRPLAAQPGEHGSALDRARRLRRARPGGGLPRRAPRRIALRRDDPGDRADRHRRAGAGGARARHQGHQGRARQREDSTRRAASSTTWPRTRRTPGGSCAPSSPTCRPTSGRRRRCWPARTRSGAARRSCSRWCRATADAPTRCVASSSSCSTRVPSSR